MSKIDLTSGDWVDLVFTGRNTSYGAYKLRKGTTKRNILSIIIVLVAALIAFAGLAVKSIVDENARKIAAMEAMQASKIENAPKKKAEVKQKVEIKEPEKVIEKVKSSVKFDVPVIKKDAEVKPEEELKTQDQIMNTKTAIGSFDVKGNDDKDGELLKSKETIAQPEPPKHEEQNKVFDLVEQMPMFPGGPAALNKYLATHVVYPPVAQENGVSGRVIVGFVVERDGSITDVSVLRSADPSLDREAVRVVKSMPKWNPGKQNGSAVRVKFNVPVKFTLQQ